MAYEVELKFPLPQPAVTIQKLHELGFREGEHSVHCDCYFQHPVRDFAVTDEAFRLRVADGNCFLTYKGPLEDPIAKTRREIELPLHETKCEEAQVRELILALGFKSVREVRKTRIHFHGEYQSHPVTVTYDSVVGLGEYMELEMIVEKDAKELARDNLLQLAHVLSLENLERRSYLRLLIAKEGA
jgi:adenylate cyclase class 2